MAPIPGWAYLAVGAVVAGYSKFVQAKNGSSIMGFFFWVGVALLMIGVFKLLVRYMLGKRPKDEERAQPAAVRARSGPFNCHKCGARLHEKSRFCNWCGAKQ